MLTIPHLSCMVGLLSDSTTVILILILLFFFVCLVQEVAEKEVKRVCFFLGPLDGQCKDMIDTYFPQMWKLLQEELVSQSA